MPKPKRKIAQTSATESNAGDADRFGPEAMIQVLKDRKVLESRRVYSEIETGAAYWELVAKNKGQGCKFVVQTLRHSTAAGKLSRKQSLAKLLKKLQADTTEVWESPARVEVVENEKTVESRDCWSVAEAVAVRERFGKEYRGAKFRLVIKRF